jgi:hypothetical protein
MTRRGPATQKLAGHSTVASGYNPFGRLETARSVDLVGPADELGIRRKVALAKQLSSRFVSPPASSCLARAHAKWNPVQLIRLLVISPLMTAHELHSQHDLSRTNSELRCRSCCQRSKPWTAVTNCDRPASVCDSPILSALRIRAEASKDRFVWRTQSHSGAQRKCDPKQRKWWPGEGRCRSSFKTTQRLAR